MRDNYSNVNTAPAHGVAQVTNVAVCFEAVERIQSRHPSLPGIGVFYGRSGDGKSVAASYIAVRTNAYYVQATSVATKKSFLDSVLREMSIPAAKNASDMLGQIAEELAKSGRPLIIDEFDHLAVSAGKVEMIRDIYESSQGSILIIGEERLPKKLERWERFHGRVHSWVPAQPVTVADAALLAPIYAPKVAIDTEVLTELVGAVRNSTRRTCTNLEMLGQRALENGMRSVTMADVQKLLPQGFVTGQSPKPRSF
ncbi:MULTISPECIES: AAA family ATPase [unclassified Psychrobacter]|uniref:AAA family ATPase n=1 Tax=unclassified Psychrobacter TaxID=196806 RepID=UPI0018F65414|nr:MULTISPECIES: ATP-binding protein [unclassified Psychrobacter]